MKEKIMDFLSQPQETDMLLALAGAAKVRRIVLFFSDVSKFLLEKVDDFPQELQEMTAGFRENVESWPQTADESMEIFKQERVQAWPAVIANLPFETDSSGYLIRPNCLLPADMRQRKSLFFRITIHWYNPVIYAYGIPRLESYRIKTPLNRQEEKLLGQIPCVKKWVKHNRHMYRENRWWHCFKEIEDSLDAAQIVAQELADIYRKYLEIFLQDN